MEDDYSHADDTIIYVLENIPGSSTQSPEYNEILDSFNSQITNKCNCNDFCVSKTCNCIENSGGSNYSFNITNNEIHLENAKINEKLHSPIFECNALCSCPHNCGNRLVQRGPLKNLYVRSCFENNKGLGLFCSIEIPKFTFVCEYAGEVITKREAKHRHEKNLLKNKMNYVFCLKEHSSNLVSQTFVDPSKFGNIGRYINHSCNPNCVIIPVRVNTPVPRLAIFSCSDILPHNELTIHYGINNTQDLDTRVPRKKCLCGTYQCTGFMPYEIY